MPHHWDYHRQGGRCSSDRGLPFREGIRAITPDFVSRPTRVRIGESESVKMNKPEFNELEKIELAEELFGIDFPDGLDVSEDLALNNPREVVDYFELHLRGWGPTPAAADFLKEMAKKHNNPGLAKGLHGIWRRDQISALIAEIFNTGDRSSGGDDDAVVPVKKPPGPKAGGRGAAQSLDDDNPSGRS